MLSDKLALLGGKPINTKSIPKYNTIGDEEKAAVLEVLDSGELSGFVASPGDDFWGGKQVRKLEEDFKKYFGVKYAVSVNSATSGLHCAMAALGISPGDEVIVPPYTMTATATAPLMMGAIPVFADIEDRTFGLDPASVEKNITERTKGIIVVNLFGHPAQLDNLKKLADRYGLFLVEDNAQAPDAIYYGSKTGTIGDVGVFSFNRHKIIQSGEGGVVITNDEKVALKLALFRNHGEGLVGPMGITDIVNTVGLNYRMTEIEAAIASVQLKKLPTLIDQRTKLCERLSIGLSKLIGITPPVVEDNCKHVYYFHVSKYNEELTGIPRNLFVKAVNAEGFPMRAGYVKPIYLEPMYQNKIAFGNAGYPFSLLSEEEQPSYKLGCCPTVERLHDKEIILTSFIYPPLTEKDIDAFLKACAKVLSHKDELLAAEENSKHQLQ